MALAVDQGQMYQLCAIGTSLVIVKMAPKYIDTNQSDHQPFMPINVEKHYLSANSPNM